jgi:hypothetical protein
MDVTLQRNREQENLWNGRAGHAWVESQHLLEELRYEADLTKWA